MDPEMSLDAGRAITKNIMQQYGFADIKRETKTVTSKYYAPGQEEEVFVKHKGTWLEIADIGMYSPVALANFDIRCPVFNAGFGIGPDHPDYGTLREEFLRLYEAHICLETRLFPGLAELLDAIVGRRLRWGIVTNKAEHLARRLISKLPLMSSPACIIGGDTTPYFKPHPAYYTTSLSKIEGE